MQRACNSKFYLKLIEPKKKLSETEFFIVTNVKKTDELKIITILGREEA